MNGFVNLYKEKGFTSFDCVAKLRRILGQKKIGHMGTLDPDACGVLPIALGKATRLISLFDEDRKTYRCVMLLGRTTDTLDISGKILEERSVTVSEKEVEDCLLSFQGNIMQVPPMYSALKKDGKRLYELARAGITVEREERPVTVYEIKVIKCEIPKAVFEITCSKGTYIRSICDDAGKKLGSGACMEELERTAVGPFLSANSLTLSEIERMAAEDRITDAVQQMTALFPGYDLIRTVPAGDVLAHNGNSVPADLLSEVKSVSSGSRFWLLDSREKTVGIYEMKQGIAYPVKMVYED